MLKIKYAYPKLVIARTRNPEYQYEGIRIIDVSDWLLNKCPFPKNENFYVLGNANDEQAIYFIFVKKRN